MSALTHSSLVREFGHFSLAKSSSLVGGEEAREMSVVAAGSLVRTDPKISVRALPSSSGGAAEGGRAGSRRHTRRPPAASGRAFGLAGGRPGGGSVDCCREVPERGEYLGVPQLFPRRFAPVRNKTPFDPAVTNLQKRGACPLAGRVGEKFLILGPVTFEVELYY